MNEDSLSASPGTKEEISLPPAATSPTTAYRPSHLLRKTLSAKCLTGRLPITPVGELYSDAAANTSLEDLVAYKIHESSASEILDKCVLWLETERKRRHHRKLQDTTTPAADDSGDESLDLLEALLKQRPVRPSFTSHSHNHSRRSSRRKSLLSASSDTEYASDGDAVVPECVEWLKNPEEIGWDAFKLEVLKLAHTLRCKGWRRVELGRFKEVGVSRISGALTNAVSWLYCFFRVMRADEIYIQVYMVTPPADIPASTSTLSHSSTSSLPHPPRQSPKLLLRIYGPQVSHLIDRETELYILRRLARQKIGPRLLGTFLNGRFEEFFTSKTLTKDDIRVPETSRHIAKRLKELHEGIDLEDAERTRGPIVWKNWEKWIPRCTSVISRLPPNNRKVCGTSWEIFLSAVSRYRSWLVTRYGGEEQLNNQLVFAHNDTQYGNILRLQANEKSPLLLPSNEHRQLIVIDFEYASANTPGFEFANHFCEWMADYHAPQEPWRIRERRYPTGGEMRNFLRAYVEHSLRGSRVDAAFNLDARVPIAKEQESKGEVEKEVDRLLSEAKAWRAASSAMWAAWGIVQARVEGEEEEEGEFDYLLYAQQRALLFWGDCLSLGVFTEEEMEGMEPGLVGRAKVIG
ncbi:kinase-like domain-containing protein [Trichophaea hybrida]|nr:kinase-like domain-containing protein [Trichophaea hybrida]